MSTGAEQFITPITLDRDTFMRRLIASLGHLNEGILGSTVTGAYIMNVGLSMGAAIEAEYKRFWGINRPLTLDEYAHVIVDLKQKIQGNFSLVSKTPEQVVVQTTSCPFDEFVRQSPSLCFMTSSVFGGIAARNFGYAKVVLQRRIALGDPGCYVIVHLERTAEAEASLGREYFPDVDQASPDIVQQLQLMTSLRTLRQQLSETSARWEELVQTAPEAIAVLTSEGRISFANARWREVLGIEGDELVGSRLDQLVHPEEQASTRLTQARVGQGERSLGQALRLRHRDGSWRDTSVSMSAIHNEAGAVIGTLAIVRDVTEERSYQRLKETLLSTTSHELRTPIATIRALADVLLRTLDHDHPLEPAQLSRRLQTIRREADRIALLANDLVDVSRIGTGQLPLRLTPHDLNEVAEAAVQQQHDLLPDPPHHQLRLSLAPEPLMIQMDRPRLEQVLHHLLDNAVKYSPDGGTIQIETACSDGVATVTIADPGIGIPAEDLTQVFTPFFRGSNASISHFDGLGLGLHLSRMIIEAHQGTITISSPGEAGTIVTLRLPLSGADQRASA